MGAAAKCALNNLGNNKALCSVFILMQGRDRGSAVAIAKIPFVGKGIAVGDGGIGKLNVAVAGCLITKPGFGWSNRRLRRQKYFFTAAAGSTEGIAAYGKGYIKAVGGIGKDVGDGGEGSIALRRDGLCKGIAISELPGKAQVIALDIGFSMKGYRAARMKGVSGYLRIGINEEISEAFGEVTTFSTIYRPLVKPVIA